MIDLRARDVLGPPIRQPADRMTEVRFSRLNRASKLGLDFICAFILLILSAPLILLSILLVKLTSRGPAIYSQIRLGLKGRPYTIYKIRTMPHDCERQTGPRWGSRRDPRSTPVGGFLRRSHIDELPQLWNVLRGEMSLVGPRPERPEFVSQLERVLPRYRDRMLVRPGLTGLAQVQLPPDTDLASVWRKLACDLYYVQQANLWFDLRILLSTAGYLLGIPFSFPHRLLGVPSSEDAEGLFEILAEEQLAAVAAGVNGTASHGAAVRVCDPGCGGV
jgi:lipopolysaccharide/colanic/teichoic acid biosynthesis glycosyltransferase